MVRWLNRLALAAALAIFGGTAYAIDQAYFPQPSGQQPAAGALLMCMNGGAFAVPCDVVEVCVTPTVTAAGYGAGNEVGGLITIVVPNTAAGLVLQSVRLDFKDAQTAEFDVFQFSANPSNSTWTDKSAPAVNAADVFKVLPPIKLTNNSSGLGTHTVYGADAIGRALARSTTSDFFVVVTPGTPTLGSTSDMQFCASYL